MFPAKKLPSSLPSMPWLRWLYLTRSQCAGCLHEVEEQVCPWPVPRSPWLSPRLSPSLVSTLCCLPLCCFQSQGGPFHVRAPKTPSFSNGLQEATSTAQEPMFPRSPSKRGSCSHSWNKPWGKEICWLVGEVCVNLTTTRRLSWFPEGESGFC